MNPYQQELDWYSLYAGDTSRDDLLFTPESIAHPAKMSLPLLHRILAQMQAWEWLEPGDVVADPFGGRMTTGLVWCGLHPENRAVCIELEPHFVAMGEVNREHARRRLGREVRLEIVQGDSREADRLLAEVGVGVTSPPYGDIDLQVVKNSENKRGGIGAAFREGRIPKGTRQDQDYGTTPGQIGALPDRDPAAAVLSPPYGQGTITGSKTDAEALIARTPSLKGRDPNGAWFKALAAGYENSPGNIDNCPDAVVTSPPYEASLNSDDPDKRGGLFRDPKRRNDRTLTGSYAGAVTSPPHEDAINAASHGIDWTKAGKATGNRKRGKGCKHEETLRAQLSYQAGVTSPPFEAQSGGHPIPESGPLSDPRLHARHAASKINEATGYAENTGGQIGTTQGEDYATACGKVYAALARAGVRRLCTVTKNPTRGGKLRRLDKLTARLLRQSGYRVVAWRRSWLWHSEAQVNALRGQLSLFEAEPSRRLSGRLSFFKRLQLAKGGVAAQFEDVFFAVLDGGLE